MKAFTLNVSGVKAFILPWVIAKMPKHTVRGAAQIVVFYRW